jgi:hypothetical protein
MYYAHNSTGKYAGFILVQAFSFTVQFLIAAIFIRTIFYYATIQEKMLAFEYCVKYMYKGMHNRRTSTTREMPG